MKFEVTRTSTWFNEDIKCEEARQEEFVVGEHLCKRWVVEINTLEELIAFVKKYEDRIVLITDEKSGLPKIEIYDDWRE